MLALILTLFFAVMVALGAIVGLIRGVKKATVRLITLVVAVILTFIFAGPITHLVAQNVRIEGQTLGEMILASAQEMEMVGDILAAAPLLREAILATPAFVLSIVVFPVVFILVSFVSWIVFLIVHWPLRRLIFREGKDGEGSPSFGARIGMRFAGLGVGIVTGALIFGVLVSPLLGLFSVLPDKNEMAQTMDTVVEQGYLSATDADTVMELYEVTDSPLVNGYSVVAAAAGRSYINSVSKIEADGQTTYLADEFDTLLAVVRTAMEGGLVDALLASDDQQALYQVLADEAFMDALMQDMFQSKLLRSAVPEVMAIAMENAAVSMNVPADKNAVYDNMMGGVALAVQNASIDYAGIKAYEDAYGTSYRLYRSASTRAATNELMTREEYEAEVQKLEALVDVIALIIDAAVSGDNGQFADQVALCIVDQISTQVSENGQDALASFDAESVQAAIANISSVDVQTDAGDAEQLLQQLTDKEKFETDMATVETIKESIRASVKDAMADDNKAMETASTLATIVSDFTAAFSSAANAEGGVDITKLDYDRIANAVTALQHSPLKGVGSSVLDLVASGDLGSNSTVGALMAAVKEGYENGEDIGGAIKTVGALVQLGAALGSDEETKPESGGAVSGETGSEVGGESGGTTGGESDSTTGSEVGGATGGESGGAASGESGGQSSQKQEAVVESLISLINNLNEFTIGLLPSVLSTDTFVSMGVPAEYADATYSVVETLLKELMKLQGAEDYTAEVNSIVSLYNLATTGVEQFTEDDIASLVGYAVESDAIFNTLVSISVSNPFGIRIEDEAVQLNIAEAIENYYAQSGKTQRERDICNAVATLLGVDGKVMLG